MSKLALEVWIGITAAGLTFLAAIGQNLFWVSLERAVYAFVIFFALSAVIHWGYRFVFPAPAASSETGSGLSGSETEATGQESANSAKEEVDQAEAFSPLMPPRIVRKELSADAQDVLNAIRRFTDE